MKSRAVPGIQKPIRFLAVSSVDNVACPEIVLYKEATGKAGSSRYQDAVVDLRPLGSALPGGQVPLLLGRKRVDFNPH